MTPTQLLHFRDNTECNFLYWKGIPAFHFCETRGKGMIFYIHSFFFFSFWLRCLSPNHWTVKKFPLLSTFIIENRQLVEMSTQKSQTNKCERRSYMSLKW